MSEQASGDPAIAAMLAQLRGVPGYAGACVVDVETASIVASTDGLSVDLDDISLRLLRVVGCTEQAVLDEVAEPVSQIMLSTRHHHEFAHRCEQGPLRYTVLVLSRDSGNVAVARYELAATAARI